MAITAIEAVLAVHGVGSKSSKTDEMVAAALEELSNLKLLAKDAAGVDRFPPSSSEHARRTHSAMRLVRMLAGEES